MTTWCLYCSKEVVPVDFETHVCESHKVNVREWKWNTNDVSNTWETLNIDVKLLHPDAKVPEKVHSGDACYDLFSTEHVVLEGHEVAKVHFGISLAIPAGWEGQLRPRSSSFLRKNLMVHFGTIDSQYRGELVAVVSLMNPNIPVTIKKGEAIAQIGIRRATAINWEVVDEHADTERGEGGFGSTG